MERPRSAAAARQEVKTRTHKMLLESGIPALLEKLLADCFMSCPARPLEFLASALENHVAGKGGQVPGALPVADRPTTPAGLKENFDQSAREVLSAACVTLMKDLVKAKPENPIEFTLLRLRNLQQELENEETDGDTEMKDAAVRIQAVQRGKSVRKEREEMTSAATKIQSVQRGKAARKQVLPNIETRLLSWSEEIAASTGLPFVESAFDSLTEDETEGLKKKFEEVKKQRFEGAAADFWRFVASSFTAVDSENSGFLDRQGFHDLCATIFGSLGNLENATGGSIDQFFENADSNQSGKVSFAELVAVFVLEELRSPELRKWVEAQQEETTLGKETTVELSEEDAALKIQSGFRGGAARKEVASRKREDRHAEVQSKYDEWRQQGQDAVEG